MNTTTSHRLANLEGLVDADVGMRLLEMAQLVSNELAIVEIGSYKGKSSCYLAEGAKRGFGAHVHCIEPWNLPGNIGGKHNYTDPDVEELFHMQVAEMDLMDQISAHNAFSHDFVKQWTDPIGLLFIDGSHIYKDVKQDFEDYSPFVVPNGLVVFDDFSKRNPGVMRLVNELNRSHVLVNLDMFTPPLAIGHLNK